MNIKNIIRSMLNLFHLDLTKNLEYDRLTKLIMKKCIKENSSCIDVGCHKGEIMDVIVSLAPRAKHFAFEPIPEFYNLLSNKYSKNIKIFPFALSDQNGTTKFQFVKNAPAYSGIKQRKYEVKNPDIEEIEVELKKLDEVIPTNLKIDFIKIDVEGAEFGVLKGAANILKNNKPVVVFEFGLGASDYYGTKPEEIFKFLTQDVGLQITTLKSFVNLKQALDLNQFVDLYNTNKEYYFIAY